MNRETLFPTPIYFKDLPNAKELNKYLFKYIKNWYKSDPQGEIKTNSGYGWHSKTNMNEKDLIKTIFKECT